MQYLQTCGHIGRRWERIEYTETPPDYRGFPYKGRGTEVITKSFPALQTLAMKYPRYVDILGSCLATA
jgi:hypothetical protein